jgi:hypothetical protein
MQRADLAPLRSDPQRPRCDADEGCRMAQVEPRLDAVRGYSRNWVMAA